mgnify:CR=1 FL=1
MERIKLAISQAREAAERGRQEPPRDATSVAAAPAPDAPSTDGRSLSKGRSGMWGLLALLALIAMSAYWVGKTGARPAQVATPAPVTPLPVAAVVPDAAPLSNEPRPVPSSDGVAAAVEAWRQAWSARDMPSYLAAYSEAFVPPDGLSREDWVASRHRNVGGRTSIDVRVSNLQVWFQGDRRARASFLQDYASGRVREAGRPKTLDFVMEADGRWRIVSEGRGDAPPASSTATN